jgi:hypothetical protein
MLVGLDVHNNDSEVSGGAIWVGGYATDKLVIDSSWFMNNSHLGNPFNAALNTFNTESYNAIRCLSYSHFSGLYAWPWFTRNPRLKGDGTCTFENW